MKSKTSLAVVHAQRLPKLSLDDGYELEIATYDGRPLAFDVGGRHQSVGRCDAPHHDPIVNPNIS